MSGPGAQTSVLYLAATLRAMIDSRDPRRWTAGAIVACRTVTVLLWTLAVPVAVIGWDHAAGWMAAIGLAVYGAEGIAERIDDEVTKGETEDE